MTEKFTLLSCFKDVNYNLGNLLFLFFVWLGHNHRTYISFTTSSQGQNIWTGLYILFIFIINSIVNQYSSSVCYLLKCCIMKALHQLFTNNLLKTLLFCVSVIFKSIVNICLLSHSNFLFVLVIELQHHIKFSTWMKQVSLFANIKVFWGLMRHINSTFKSLWSWLISVINHSTKKLT